MPPPHLSPRCSSAWNTSAKGAWLVAPLAWLHAALRARPSLLALGFEKARLREAFRCEVTDVGGCRCGLPKIPSGELETSGPLLLSGSPRARHLCPRGSAAICAQEPTRLDGGHCAYGREGYTPHGRLFSMRAFLARSAALVAAWPLEPLPGFMNRHNHTVLARWSWQPRLEMNRVLAASHPELVYEAAAMARGLQVLYVDPWTAGLQRVDLIP